MKNQGNKKGELNLQKLKITKLDNNAKTNIRGGSFLDYSTGAGISGEDKTVISRTNY